MKTSRDILKLSTLDIHSASQLFKTAPAFFFFQIAQKPEKVGLL